VAVCSARKLCLLAERTKTTAIAEMNTANAMIREIFVTP